MEQIIERVTQMEEILDRFRESRDPELRAILEAYLQSGYWLADYEADERGELPRELKRGILSQDGLYDLLNEN